MLVWLGVFQGRGTLRSKSRVVRADTLNFNALFWIAFTLKRFLADSGQGSAKRGLFRGGWNPI